MLTGSSLIALLGPASGGKKPFDRKQQRETFEMNMRKADIEAAKTMGILKPKTNFDT